jgi:hypothetical protein
MNHDEAISIDGSDCFGWTRGLHLEFKLQTTNNLLKQKKCSLDLHVFHIFYHYFDVVCM